MNRLLIVDDEHHIVNWLAELFQSVEDLDLEIMKAYSGFEMLNILQSYRMDIILLDIQMPGMTGLTAAQDALSEWPSTHIVFLTAYDNFQYLYQANQLPHTSYLLKTEDDETIVDTIRKVLQQIQVENDTRNALEQANTDKLLLDHLLQQDFLRTLIHGNYNQINVLISGRQKKLVPIDFTKEVCLLLTHCTNSSSTRLSTSCLSYVKNLVYEKFSFSMLELDTDSMLWFFQDNRPQDRQSLSDVASCINYNATYVARLYKQLRGVSLTDYITRCRIQKAITLLLTTGDSIQSIAKDTGFDTSQYFSIVFKKEVGMPPRDYRATHLPGK